MLIMRDDGQGLRIRIDPRAVVAVFGHDVEAGHRWRRGRGSSFEEPETKAAEARMAGRKAWNWGWFCLPSE